MVLKNETLREPTQHFSVGDRAEIVAVTPSMWDAIRPQILEIEDESFPPSLADSEDDLRAIVYSPTGIFLALRAASSRQVLGYIAADLLEKFPNIPGTTSDPQFNKGNTIYIESVAVHPDWRRRGFATALVRECLKKALQRGIKRITAHIDRRAKTRIGVGVLVLNSFSNWYQTDRTYDYVEFPLEK